ncbi:hypothetical protein D3C81_704410 [compost metagenome]
MARVGVMPTPPLISTSGLSLSVSTKSPDGGVSWTVSPTCTRSWKKFDTLPPCSRLTLMR